MRQPLHIYAYDAAASLAMGAAVGFSVWGVFDPPVLVAACAGAIAFLRVLGGLGRIRSMPAQMPLFDPVPLEFEAEELVLDRAIERDGGPVVRLVQPLPTPGELRDTVERYLEVKRQPADATEELRGALTQLRRSVA